MLAVGGGGQTGCVLSQVDGGRGSWAPDHAVAETAGICCMLVQQGQVGSVSGATDAAANFANVAGPDA